MVRTSHLTRTEGTESNRPMYVSRLSALLLCTICLTKPCLTSRPGMQKSCLSYPRNKYRAGFQNLESRSVVILARKYRALQRRCTYGVRNGSTWSATLRWCVGSGPTAFALVQVHQGIHGIHDLG